MTYFSVHGVKEIYIDSEKERMVIKIITRKGDSHYVELFGDKIKILELPRKEWRFKE